MRHCRRASRADFIVVACCIVLMLLTLGAAGESARQLAQELLCLSNNETLTGAWLAYAEDNDGQLVGGGTGKAMVTGPMQWVDRAGEDAGLDERVDAIRRGALFAYVGDLNVYHCPADRGLNDPNNPLFRTYAIAGGANGEFWAEYDRATVLTDLERPAEQYIFVEEAAPRGDLIGSWQMNPASKVWVDPLAIWHTESTTLGFADGHAEVRRWHDRSLIEWCQRAMDPSKPFSFILVPPDDEQTDITYMAEHFPYESLR